jgi:hypothetical protein
MAKKFSELSESEILALVIALEEEDSRIYGDFADGLRVQRRPVWLIRPLGLGVVRKQAELLSYVRHPYMDTPFLAATLQVVVGGVLVFLAGLLIGSA